MRVVGSMQGRSEWLECGLVGRRGTWASLIVRGGVSREGRKVGRGRDPQDMVRDRPGLDLPRLLPFFFCCCCLVALEPSDPPKLAPAGDVNGEMTAGSASGVVGGTNGEAESGRPCWGGGDDKLGLATGCSTSMDRWRMRKTAPPDGLPVGERHSTGMLISASISAVMDGLMGLR